MSRSWSLFIWGLLISLFLGSAIRIVFSPKRMERWVSEVAAKRQPKFLLEFERAKLTLATTFPPKLGVEFINTRLKAKDACITGSEVSIDHLILPVSWNFIWKHQLHFAGVSAGHLKVIYQKPECSQQMAVPELDQMIRTDNDLQKIEKYLARRWQREVKNTLRYLDSLDVAKISIYNQREENFLIAFEDIYIQLDGESKSARVDFQVNPSESLLGFKVSGVSDFVLLIQEKGMELHGKGNVLEGRYIINSEWNVSEKTIISDLTLRDFPAPEMLQFVDFWKFTDIPKMSFRNQWFRCESRVHLNTALPKEPKVSYGDCSLYGEYGKVKIPDRETPVPFDDIYPLKVELQDFQMQALNAPNMDKVEAPFWTYSGVLDGELQLTTPEDLFLRGKLRDMQVNLPLWDQSVWSQIFTSANVEGRLEKQRISYKLTQMESATESLQGELQASKSMSVIKMSDLVEKGELVDSTVSLEWSFKSKGELKHPRNFISFLKSASDLKFSGSGNLEGKKWQKLSADLSLGKMSSEGAVLRDFKVELSSLAGSGNLQMNAAELNIAKASPGLFKKLKERLQSSELKDLQMSVRFDSEGRWALDPLSFKVSDDIYQLLGRGFQMTLDESVFQMKDSASKRYMVTGPLLDPRFEESL